MNDSPKINELQNTRLYKAKRGGAKKWEKEKTAVRYHLLMETPCKVLELYLGLSKPSTSILVQMHLQRIGGASDLQPDGGQYQVLQVLRRTSGYRGRPSRWWARPLSCIPIIPPPGRGVIIMERGWSCSWPILPLHSCLETSVPGNPFLVSSKHTSLPRPPVEMIVEMIGEIYESLPFSWAI